MAVNMWGKFCNHFFFFSCRVKFTGQSSLHNVSLVEEFSNSRGISK